MPTYQKAPESVRSTANDLIRKYETHEPLASAQVVIDLLMAFGNVDDETGEKTGDAITSQGYRCLASTRVVNLRDRAKGNGDAEIILDGDEWANMEPEEQAALLDHELHHLKVKVDKRGVVRDDLGRPKLELRKHDHHFGWFDVIAARHGQASQEQKQAKVMFLDHGQYYWPEIAAMKNAETPLTRFAKVASGISVAK